MYEFLCDRVIPGCTHTERAETEQDAKQAALKHLYEHHGIAELDDQQRVKIDMAIVGIHR